MPLAYKLNGRLYLYLVPPLLGVRGLFRRYPNTCATNVCRFDTAVRVRLQYGVPTPPSSPTSNLTMPLRVTPTATRRFLTNAFGLNGFQTLPDVSAALARLQFVQEDSINICGRIHDLILWARVRDYAPSLLHDVLYGEPRRAFEYTFPNLCVLPLTDLPYFARAMQKRAAQEGRWGAFSPDEQLVADRLLALMDANGPLRTRTHGDEDGHTVSGWGTRTKIVSHVADRLYLQGRLGIARRDGFERWFDRMERLLPPDAASVLASDSALPSEADERAFLIRKRLAAKRLFRPKAAEVAVLGREAFTQVEIAGARRPWFVLTEDVARLASADALPVGNDALLLAPLDPLVYDRERTRDVFDFEYTWEVYTPEARRRWGYYVLPVLVGDQLAARIDPKMDRRASVLTLRSVRFEPNADVIAVTGPIARRLRAFARFLGANTITVGLVEPDAARGPLVAALETENV